MKPETMLPERLRELRSGNKMTQAQIATALGESVSNYNKWENGTTPPLEAIVKIANYHEVSIDYLLGHSEIRAPNSTYGIELSANTRLKLHLVAADLGINANALAEKILKIFLLYKR